MNFLPISINIDQKKILIIGGGNVAYHKIILLQRFTNNITIVAKEVIAKVKETGVKIIIKEYDKNDIDGFILVYAATNDRELNKAIRADGKEKNILVNAVDDPSICDFVSPAIYRNGNMTVAVGSNGEDVYRAIAWRDKIKDIFENGYFKAWWYSKSKRRKTDLPQTKVKQRDFIPGYVYLVGFGPGDPDLMTIKAHKALEAADVIFYDDLLDSGILTKYNGKKYYVGKRRDNHHKEQDEINNLLKEAALKGNIVVRLKGGDPLIFGRGIEEKKFLTDRGVPVEIIPGITSGIAASALSGIPLTHRGVASSVAIGTAHAKNSFKILESDTSVYYMGARNLKDIAKKYLEQGYPADFPVGIVYNVSLPDQEVIITNISEIIQSEIEYKSPIISIFGYTVNERV